VTVMFPRVMNREQHWIGVLEDCFLLRDEETGVKEGCLVGVVCQTCSGLSIEGRVLVYFMQAIFFLIGMASQER
jgi:hypothetical protein